MKTHRFIATWRFSECKSASSRKITNDASPNHHYNPRTLMVWQHHNSRSGQNPPPNPRYDVIILSDPKAFSRSRCLGALLPAPWKNTIPRVLKLHENARSFEGLVVVCVFLSRVWCWCCSCLFWSFLSCAVVAFLPSAFFCPLVFLLFCFAPLFCSSPPLVSSSALLLCSSALLWLALLCSHWFSINLNYSSMLSHLLPDHPSKF